MGTIALNGLALLLLLLAHGCPGQEWNLGLSGGVVADLHLRDATPGFQAIVEHRPEAARISVNTGPGILFVEDRALLSIPLYLKVIFGDRIRLCPTLGALYWTRPAWGMMAGLELEIRGHGRWTPYLSTNYLGLSFDEDAPSKFGGTNSERSRVHGLGATVGVKIALR